MFHDNGNPTHLIKFMYAMCNEPGGEQDEQNSCHLEEATQIEANGGGE